MVLKHNFCILIRWGTKLGAWMDIVKVMMHPLKYMYVNLNEMLKCSFVPMDKSYVLACHLLGKPNLMN